MFFIGYSKKIKQQVDEKMKIFDQLKGIDTNDINEIRPLVCTYINQLEKLNYFHTQLSRYWSVFSALLIMIIAFILPPLILNLTYSSLRFNSWLFVGFVLGMFCIVSLTIFSIGLSLLLSKIRISPILANLVLLGLPLLAIPLDVVFSYVIPLSWFFPFATPFATPNHPLVVTM